MSAVLRPVLADEKVVSLDFPKPFLCEWCLTLVMPYQSQGDFKGTAMHRYCGLEARIADLAGIVEQQGKQIKELSLMVPA